MSGKCSPFEISVKIFQVGDFTYLLAFVWLLYGFKMDHTDWILETTNILITLTEEKWLFFSPLSWKYKLGREYTVMLGHITQLPLKQKCPFADFIQQVSVIARDHPSTDNTEKTERKWYFLAFLTFCSCLFCAFQRWMVTTCFLQVYNWNVGNKKPYLVSIALIQNQSKPSSRLFSFHYYYLNCLWVMCLMWIHYIFR